MEIETAFPGTLGVQNTCNPATYCFLLKRERCGEKQHGSRPGYFLSHPAFRKITVTFGMDPGVVLALSAHISAWITLEGKAGEFFA